MRGQQERSGFLFSYVSIEYVSIEERIPANPAAAADPAAGGSAHGSPQSLLLPALRLSVPASVPPEQLLLASLLQVWALSLPRCSESTAGTISSPRPAGRIWDSVSPKLAGSAPRGISAASCSATRPIAPAPIPTPCWPASPTPTQRCPAAAALNSRCSPWAQAGASSTAVISSLSCRSSDPS